MKTFRITVPYTYMVSGEYEHEIPESEILEIFGVDDLADIDPDELAEHLRGEANDLAYYTETEEICQLVREQRGMETDPDNIAIEEITA